MSLEGPVREYDEETLEYTEILAEVRSMQVGLGRFEARILDRLKKENNPVVKNTSSSSVDEKSDTIRTQDRRPPLLNLPMELLERISGYCWGDSLDLALDGEYRDEYELPVRTVLAKDSLGFRLACRHIAEHTFRPFARAFFSDLTAIFTTRSLTRLLEISRHPRLAKVPRRISIGHHLLPGPNDAVAANGFLNLTVPNILAYGSSDDLDWHDGFFAESKRLAERYKGLCRAQKAMSDNGADVAMLGSVIASLPNLSALEISSNRWYWNDGLRDTLPLRHWGISDFESLGLYSLKTILQSRTAAKFRTNATVLVSKVLFACDLARRHGWSGELESLRLDGPEEYSSWVMRKRPQALQLQLLVIPPSIRRQGLPSVTSLVLDISPYLITNRDEDQGLHRAKRNLSMLITSRLKELTINLADELPLETTYEIADSLLRHVVAASQRCQIRIFRLWTTSHIEMNDILNLIRYNRRTLQSLDLQVTLESEVKAREGELYRAVSRCTQLRDFCFALEDDDGNVDDECRWRSSLEIKTGLVEVLGCDDIDMTDDDSDEASFRAQMQQYFDENLLWPYDSS